MTDGIPLVRLRDGTWHRGDRNRCVQSTGSAPDHTDRVAPDEVSDLRPRCPYCFRT
ncbi:MAG: hypothetical protein ABEJ82_08000 [Haloplanus sp.]